MIEPTTPRRRYDDNDQCVGCGAHISEPCDPDCQFETGQPAPTFTLRYEKDGQLVERVGLDAAGVERVGAVVVRVADRKHNISNIAVLDTASEDVTFDFACFREDTSS